MTPRLAACALLISASLSAQTDWSALAPATTPPAYTAHAMAYFLPTDTTVLFGGVIGGVRSSDTWIWNGSDWTMATPNTVPPARVAHTLVYDFLRSRLVMFGGIDASGGVLGDTWEWDGADWTQITPASQSPAPRRSHCMTYHPTRGTSVLFGGFNGADLNDTWEWDGVDWSQVTTATSPTPRRASDISWDPTTDNILLFAGYQQTNDTWMFDGTDWALLTPSVSPTPRYDHSMVADRSRNRIVMFGSFTAGDTWEWDGSTWLDRTAANPPTPRVDTYLAYDWLREEVTMFGSVATPETLRYAAITPATWTPLGGQGCPGTSGQAPTLVSDQRPWLGETFAITINQLPNAGIGLMISGLSDQTSTIGPLPAPLGSIGMPGCELRVDPVIINAVFATGTSATWSLNIPFDPNLLGQQFFSQCGALDVGANPANLTTGNYGAAVIGGK